MNLLTQLLYGQTPYPLPQEKRTVCNDDCDGPVIPPVREGYAWCSCGRHVMPLTEMPIRPNGTVAKTCNRCAERRARNYARDFKGRRK